VTGPNAETIEAWNTVLYDKFARYRQVLATGLSVHGDAAILRHPPGRGERVLDFGCGFGDTTLQLARAADDVEVLGVDVSRGFVETARREAAALGAARVVHAVGDVQTMPLPGPFHLAFSRFGSMFFASPVEAFRNVRRAMAHDGRLCLVVWRRRDANPWLTVPERVVRELLQVPAAPPPEAPAPGPFALADVDLASDALVAAGFDHVAFERHDAPLRLGGDLAEAVEHALGLGPAAEVLRLAGDEGARRRPELEAALTRALAPFATASGVHLDSSAWIVTARNP
jgi:ubiquinone/menaquinone biosynthesis C-methylase UbiE